jgi:DUF3014 family protein
MLTAEAGPTGPAVPRLAMSDVADYEIHRPPGDSLPPEPPRRRPIGLWIALALLVAAIGVAVYVAFVWQPGPSAPAARTSAAPPAGSQPTPPLGGQGDAIELPPLDTSDTLVRTLVQRLSESPAIMAWLPTSGLIRNFVVVSSNIAEGANPAKLLKVLKPASPIRIVDRDGATLIDPRSYDRYNRIAEAIASIDPAAAAKLYATLKPRIEEAHRDLGVQNESFDRTLERAIASLLEAPVLDTSPRLKPKGIGYGYVDPQLEDLTPAQKQLLRMGPRNVRVIKARLREIALTLGIPASHLPVR